MPIHIYIPDSLRDAGRRIRQTYRGPLDRLSKENFSLAWCAMAYLFPGMHPDSLNETGNNWPSLLRRFVAEAWRRADAGELTDDELYCSDATWAGLYDRMQSHTPEELERRQQLAAEFGDAGDARGVKCDG